MSLDKQLDKLKIECSVSLKMLKTLQEIYQKRKNYEIEKKIKEYREEFISAYRQMKLINKNKAEEYYKKYKELK